MNRAATVLALLLALAAVAAAISLRACKPDSPGKDGLVLDLDPAGVRIIKIQSGNKPFELRRKGARWEFRANKVRDAANPALAEEVLRAATSLAALDHIPAADIRDKEVLSDFGVRSPKRWIEFSSGSRTTRLLIGKNAAFEGRIYVRVDGAPDVFVTEEALARVVDLEPDKFRDNILSRLEPDQVHRLILRIQPDAEIELQRDASGWKITKPLTAQADEEVVRKYLISLLQLPIEGIVSDDSGDLGIFGIKEGLREIAFYAEGRETPLVLRLGAADTSAPKTLLAQFTGRDIVARVPAQVAGLLDVTPDTFRDRRLLPLNPDLVDLIRISGPESEAPLEIRRSADGWVLGGAERKPVSPTAVQRLFDGLATLRVSEFLRKDPPPASRVIRFYSVLSENTPEESAGEQLVASLEIGEPAEGEVEIKVSGAPGAVKVPDALLQWILADPETWQLPVQNP